MELLDAEQTVLETLQARRSRWRIARLAQSARRRVRLLGRRRRQALPRALGRREGAPRARAHALRPAELPRARRADQPPRPRHQGDAGPGARATSRARCSSSRTIGSFLRALSNRVLELTAGGPAHVRRRLRRVRRADRPRGARRALTRRLQGRETLFPSCHAAAGVQTPEFMGETRGDNRRRPKFPEIER